MCCRQDLVEGRYLEQESADDHVQLAGLALMTEFGEYIDLIHGGGAYFSLHHYLPHSLRLGSN